MRCLKVRIQCSLLDFLDENAWLALKMLSCSKIIDAKIIEQVIKTLLSNHQVEFVVGNYLLCQGCKAQGIEPSSIQIH